MNLLALGLLMSLSAVGQPSAEEKAHSLNVQGNRLAEVGKYAEAQAAYRESLDIWRSMGPGYTGHIAGTLLNYGMALSGDGQRPAAAKILEEALALHRSSLGPNHHRTVSNMNLLASNYLMLGAIGKAETLLTSALRIEREFFPQDIQTARSLEGLSNLLIKENRPAEALPLAEEALTLAIKSTGEDSVDTALAYTSVAEAHRYLGASDRALPLYRKARMLYEKTLGTEHPRVATILSQEGLILMNDGKLNMAEKAMLQCLNALRKSCPACGVEIALAEHNLGLLRLKQKRYAEANEALTAAVELREKFAVQPGPELADALQSLAFAREKLKLFDDAARLNSRAQVIRNYR
ncbi:MAG: tetratricopeptide repeat protein [Candidatus Solibacter sp.]